MLITSINGQYYIRGEVSNEKDIFVSYARIVNLTTKEFFQSGQDGVFIFAHNKLEDSFLVYRDGYQQKRIKLFANQFNKVKLNLIDQKPVKAAEKLNSLTKGVIQSENLLSFKGDETYTKYEENFWIKTEKNSITKFGVNNNKASYSNIRRLLKNLSYIPPDAVRIEEMLNYFNLNYTEPQHDGVEVQTKISDCPWKSTDKLLFLNINASKVDLREAPPSNFVFLIDNSGSMDMPNRLPLLKSAFKILVEHLRPQDKISIVTYGGNVVLLLQPTSGAEKQKIYDALDKMEASGDTPGENAIAMAYNIAEKNYVQNGVNRIILATDGDFNVGISKEKDLEEFIIKKRELGVYLTCLGVGMGNYKDSKLEILAKRGNGNFAYLDNINEAEKFLVSEFSNNMYTVANDVKVSVQFYPECVNEYRLIGYDNKKDVSVDSSSQIEGGELGSKNSCMAVFQVNFKNNISNFNSVGNVEVSYVPAKLQKEIKHSKTISYNYENLNSINNDLKLATNIVMFGLILKDSKYAKELRWEDCIQHSKQIINPNDLYQKEYAEMVQLAKKVYKMKREKY